MPHPLFSISRRPTLNYEIPFGPWWLHIAVSFFVDRGDVAVVHDAFGLLAFWFCRFGGCCRFDGGSSFNFFISDSDLFLEDLCF